VNDTDGAIPENPRRRFLTIEKVADALNGGLPTVSAQLSVGELHGIQVGETYSHYLETIRLGDLMLEQLITGATSIQDAKEFKDHIGGFRLRLISPEAVRTATTAHRECREVVTNFLDQAPVLAPYPAEYVAAVDAQDHTRRNLAEVMAQDLSITK